MMDRADKAKVVEGVEASDRLIALASEHIRLSETIDQLDEVIGGLERSEPLTSDADAMLGKYRQNHQRIGVELDEIERGIRELNRSLDVDVLAPMLAG